MNTNQVMEEVYVFTKQKLSEKFPEIFPLDLNRATNKIFISNGKFEKPQRPLVELDDIFKSKLHKRFNPYYKGNIEYTPMQWRVTVKFEVKTTNNEGNLIGGKKQANQIIDYIENLFTNNQETFNHFDTKGIIINELESSDVRDLSRFMFTNNEFVKSIDICFEYEEIEERVIEYGKFVGVDIKVDNSNNSIKMEVDNQ